MSDAPRPTTRNAGQHFRQFNALVDTHLRYAPTPVLKAVLAVMRCANTEGESYVTPGTVAEKTGMNLRNAQRALADADAMGLLPVVARGNGRGNSTLRRLSLAETAAQCATVSRKETPAQRDAKPRRNETVNPGAMEQETPADCAEPSVYSSARTSSNTNSKRIAAVAESSFSEEEKAQSFASLRAVGVSPDAAKKFAGRLSPSVVSRIIGEVSKARGLSNPAGQAVKLCKAEIETGDIAAEVEADERKEQDRVKWLAEQAEAQRQRDTEAAEAQKQAQAKAAESQAQAQAWLLGLDVAELERLQDISADACPWQKYNPSDPAYAVHLYKLKDDTSARERAAKAKADRAAKAEADRKAAEELAKADQQRAEWLDAEGDKLPALVEAFFAKWPHERPFYNQTDPRKNKRLADTLREVTTTGRLDVSAIATAQEVGAA